MIRYIIPAVAACLLVACADEVPGVDPPRDELYFPIGIATVPDASGEAGLIAVASSDFDQRYNAGSIIALSAEQLFALAGDGSGGVVFEDSLDGAVVGGVRVLPFAGDLAYGPTSPDGTGHLFVAARGFNQLTMVDVMPNAGEGEPVLSCSTGADLVSPTDCSQAYVVNTGFTDPFSLAFAGETASRPPLVGIGHLQPVQEGNIIFGAVALADVSLMEARVAAEMVGEALPEAVRTTRVANLGGVSGMAFAGEIEGLQDSFLAAGLAVRPELLLTSFQVDADSSGGLYFLDPGPGIRVDAEVRAIEMRSLAVADTGTSTGAARRAYASVRFIAQGDSFNSGIAVVDLSEGNFTILSVLEVGEELQRPFIRDIRDASGALVARHLYVGDIRRDKVYVLDVTNDRPVVVQEINSPAFRTIDGESVQVSLLDGPSQFAFATRGDRTLAFVTNFANSTLAVIDVTDPNPATHRIIARLGMNIDANGETEEP